MPVKSTKPRRGRPVGDRAAQRRKLLRAGIKVIAEVGYSGASLRKVAKEAGHTTGAITYYFADKEAMVGAIFEFMFDNIDEMLELGDDHHTMFYRWVELNAVSDSWLAGFQLLAHARHEPRFAEIFRKRYENYRVRLSGILARQQAAGTIRGDIAPEFLADTICSICDGWMIMLPIETERFAGARLEALIESVMALLQPAASEKSGKRTTRHLLSH